MIASITRHLTPSSSSSAPRRWGVRCFSQAGTYFMQRQQVGHKLEIVFGEKEIHKGGTVPPKYPRHPTKDTDKPMLDMQTYADLKSRWRVTTKPSKQKMGLARKWHSKPNWYPEPKPCSMFVLHNQMPHTEKLGEGPPSWLVKEGGLDTTNAFAIFKTSIAQQHKVTVGDLVQAEKMHRREAGEKVIFGTVLLAGSRQWTIIGKPTIPYARVHCTIEQQTLTGERISFKYKARRRYSKFRRMRQWVTVLRVDKIEIDPAFTPNPEPPKPVRIP